MKYSIRRTSNLTLVQGYNVEIFGEGYELDMDGQVCWFAYTDDGAIAGFCTAKNIGSGMLFLSRAGVMPRYRGNGLQRRFIRVRERYARQAGIESIVTYTAPDNAESFASLQKCGYYLYRPEWRWAGDNMLYWIKHLKTP